MTAVKTFWPFPVIPRERRSEQQENEIKFLESAHAEGFRAYTFLAGSFGVEAKNGRRAEIVHRGGNRLWEIILSEHDEEVASRKMTDFTKAARAALDWLRESDDFEG